MNRFKKFLALMLVVGFALSTASVSAVLPDFFQSICTQTQRPIFARPEKFFSDTTEEYTGLRSVVVFSKGRVALSGNYDATPGFLKATGPVDAMKQLLKVLERRQKALSTFIATLKLMRGDKEILKGKSALLTKQYNDYLQAREDEETQYRAEAAALVAAITLAGRTQAQSTGGGRTTATLGAATMGVVTTTGFAAAANVALPFAEQVLHFTAAASLEIQILVGCALIGCEAARRTYCYMRRPRLGGVPPRNPGAHQSGSKRNRNPQADGDQQGNPRQRPEDSDEEGQGRDAGDGDMGQ